MHKLMHKNLIMHKNYKNESELIGHCIDELNKFPNVHAFRVNNLAVRGRRFVQNGTMKGVPDIHVMIKGQPYSFIECKMPGQEPSEDQLKFKRIAERMGHPYIVAYCLEDALKVIPPRITVFE